MSDVFFDELSIAVHYYHFCVNSGGHGVMTELIMQKMELVLENLRSDPVLVCGDTNCTLAGALIAVKLYIPDAHVEAGLQSFNRAMREEVNRVVADQLPDVLFPSTVTAVENL